MVEKEEVEEVERVEFSPPSLSLPIFPIDVRPATFRCSTSPYCLATTTFCASCCPWLITVR